MAGVFLIIRRVHSFIYSDGMLKSFLHVYELRTEDIADLNLLLDACAKKPFLADVCEIGHAFLKKHT